jgi:hypothetical protein
VLAVAVGSLACSDDADPPDQTACTGDVTVSVSSGATPTISWAPACKAFFVLVEADAGDAWGAISEGTNAIATPVQYGVTPTGATEHTPPAILTPGAPYDVTVFRWTGPGGDDGVPIGITSFTP